MPLSVILCTHNPRADHLGRTLTGLRAQTLPLTDWELLIVDNASSPPLAAAALLAWHPAGRVVREPTLGLVAARLRGISEAAGDLIVFVDDDNVLAPDFLAIASGLARQSPDIGSFGGQVHGEYETPPSPWFAARLDRLAIREFSFDTRTRQLDPAIAPCGAGLCVRAAVAQEFRKNVLTNPRRHALGREGERLFSGDDLDLAFTACDLGLEMARFPTLQLTHLIPAHRLTLRYFARLTRSHARAQLALAELRPALTDARHTAWAARRALWKWTLIAWAFSLFPSPRFTP
ncbi:MAG: glycosyltransferase [Opitutaceae bacterium]